MSTRSRLRPRTRKRQPSSWLMVESESPARTALRSLTQPKRACGVWAPSSSSRAGRVTNIELSASHISEEMAGRALRAFSQAAAMAPAMVLGDERS